MDSASPAILLLHKRSAALIVADVANRRAQDKRNGGELLSAGGSGRFGEYHSASWGRLPLPPPPEFRPEAGVPSHRRDRLRHTPIACKGLSSVAGARILSRSAVCRIPIRRPGRGNGFPGEQVREGILAGSDLQSPAAAVEGREAGAGVY